MRSAGAAQVAGDVQPFEPAVRTVVTGLEGFTAVHRAEVVDERGVAGPQAHTHHVRLDLVAQLGECLQRPLRPAVGLHVIRIERHVRVLTVAEEHRPLDGVVVPRLDQRETTRPQSVDDRIPGRLRRVLRLVRVVGHLGELGLRQGLDVQRRPVQVRGVADDRLHVVGILEAHQRHVVAAAGMERVLGVPREVLQAVGAELVVLVALDREHVVHDPAVLLGGPAEHVAEHRAAEQEEDLLGQRRGVELTVTPVHRGVPQQILVDVEPGHDAEGRGLTDAELLQELQQVLRQRPGQHSRAADQLVVLDAVVPLREVGDQRRQVGVVLRCQHQMMHRVASPRLSPRG
jgi:hypothetical protein